jgi:acyl-CoA-binding protein
MKSSAVIDENKDNRQRGLQSQDVNIGWTGFLHKLLLFCLWEILKGIWQEKTEKPGIQENSLNMIKGTYKNSTWEILKGIWQEMTEKPGIQENSLNMIKGTYKNSTTQS